MLDGHGSMGKVASIADKFLEAVTKHPFWATNIERACREELARLEGEILADSSIDCAFSGPQWPSPPCAATRFSGATSATRASP